MPWDFVLILFALGVLLPWHGTIRLRRVLATAELSSADRVALYASTIAFQWAAAATVAWRALARDLPPAKLGLAVPETAQVAFTSAVLTLVAVSVSIASLRRLARTRPEERGALGVIVEKLMPRTTLELAAFAALATTAGLCEEFLYRGFVYAVFAEFTGGSAPAAIAISAAFFALAHLYQGARGLRTAFIVGIVFGAVREWTGSLLPAMAAHFAVDLTTGIAAPILMARAGTRGEKVSGSSTGNQSTGGASNGLL